MKNTADMAAAVARIIILLEKPRVTQDERWMAVAILKNILKQLERMS